MARLSEKNVGVLNYQDLKSPKIKLLYWTCFSILLIVALLCLAPPLWVISSSLKDIKEFYAIPPTIIPRSFQPHKLLDAWNELNFWKYYANTFAVAAGTIISSIIFNGMGGYVLSRLKPKGSSLIAILMLWTMLLPHSVAMVPLFKNFLKLPLLHISLINTYWPMWLMAGANAFFVLMFKSFFDGIPMSLVEAARIDGCSNLGIFTKIILPLSKPILMVVLIFTLNSTWSDFFWPYLVLNDQNKYTVIVKIFQMRGNGGFSEDIVMAALTFAIIPPSIMFIIFQKHIMQGFTMSGIKG